MVECGALEMRFGGNVNGGSNPPLSVFIIFTISQEFLVEREWEIEKRMQRTEFISST